MAIEQLMQAVIAASPAKRRKLEAVLHGEDENKRKRDLRLVSIAEASRTLNLGRSSVYRLIDSNRLDAIELNGSRKVTMESIEQFVNGERPANEKTAAIIAERKPSKSAKQTKNADETFPFN